MAVNRCDSCPTRSSCKPTPISAIVVENLPLWATYVLGAAIFLMLWWPLAVIYLQICFLGLLLHNVLICPYCYHWGTDTCPSGYGNVSSRFFTPARGKNFAKQFKRYIAVVFPAWILPPVGGIYLLVIDFDLIMLGLVFLFCVTGFVILPIVSKTYGCKRCRNRSDCPWGPK